MQLHKFFGALAALTTMAMGTSACHDIAILLSDFKGPNSDLFPHKIIYSKDHTLEGLIQQWCYMQHHSNGERPPFKEGKSIQGRDRLWS